MIFPKNPKLAKLALLIRRKWPDICLVLGIAGSAGAAIATGVQTAKLDPILDDHKERMDKVHAKEVNDGYSEAKKKQETAMEYVKTGLKIGKLYLIPIALEGVSIAAQVSGHNALKAESLAMAAAYTSTLEAFKAYRKSVKEKNGETADMEHLGADIQEVEKQNAMGETVTEKVVVMDPGKLGMYARIFDIGNPNWSPNPESNIAFLRGQMVQANDMFHAKGHLFLNEVYDLIGIPRSEAGQYVGWVEGMGDNYIDFGMYAIANKNAIDGFEPAIWLDFNVDGDIMYIFDKMHGGNGKNLVQHMRKD